MIRSGRAAFVVGADVLAGAVHPGSTAQAIAVTTSRKTTILQEISALRVR